MHLRRSLVASALSLTLLLSSAASWAFVTVGVSITLAPPALPVYAQPEVPGPGYLWAPGYWAWSDDGYYWVPGTWVEPPQAGLLWTPGYWGWSNGIYVWNGGYWGPRVGFYGGVNYGFGYVGVGYAGGYWDHGAFFYNRAVNNIPGGVHITNIYTKTVINNDRVNRVSYNGGVGGIQVRPTPVELAAARAPHISAVAEQQRHEQVALHNPQLRASVNHGRPAIAATSRPGEFTGRGVVGAAVSPEAHNAPDRSVELRPHANGMGPQAPGANGQFRAIPERHGGAAPEAREAHSPKPQHEPKKDEQRRPDEPR